MALDQTFQLKEIVINMALFINFDLGLVDYGIFWFVVAVGDLGNNIIRTKQSSLLETIYYTTIHY